MDIILTWEQMIPEVLLQTHEAARNSLFLLPTHKENNRWEYATEKVSLLGNGKGGMCKLSRMPARAKCLYKIDVLFIAPHFKNVLS